MAAPGKKAARSKHIPTRMCLVCRQRGEKRQLIRIVRTADGISIDPSGKMNGRGAYLCAKASCWERAMNTDVVAKALKISLSDDDRARLRAQQPHDGAL